MVDADMLDEDDRPPLSSPLPRPSSSSHDTSYSSTSSSLDSDSKEAKQSRRRFPDVIAHRGFKARYPENTLVAFEAAVRAGVDAIETDVHLSRDGVVVLSHDGDLKRCFGVDKKIVDCDWAYLQTLETLVQPAQRLATLRELLVFMTASREARRAWLLLDIKLDNDPTTIIRRIAETIDEVPPKDGCPSWQSRVNMGCWTENQIPLVETYLPGFPVAHIGFSTSYARKFLAAPEIAFNMALMILQGPGGRKFIREMRVHRDRPVWAWTVNKPPQMEWCIRRELDGIITDDPELLLGVYRDFDGSKPEQRIPIKEQIFLVYVWFMASVLGSWFRRKYGGANKVPVKPIERGMKA